LVGEFIAYGVQFSKLKLFVRKRQGSDLSMLKLLLLPDDVRPTYEEVVALDSFVELTEETGGVLLGEYEPEGDIGPSVWTLAAWFAEGGRIDPGTIDNIEVLCIYSVKE